MNIKFQSCQHHHSQEEDHEPDFFEANITVDYSIDRHYGADADGNRGMEKLFINDITVQNCIDSQANLVGLPLSDRMIDDVWETVWENFQE